MDRMLYVAMTGAKETLRAQTVNNHNLANASTTGFRADLAAFQSRAVDGSGYASRVYATNAHGRLGQRVRRAAVDRPRSRRRRSTATGWIAVQGPDGKEAYTRAGDLQVDATGQLITATGQPVLGDGGPINVPPYTSIFFARDGSISIVAQGQTPGHHVDRGPHQAGQSADEPTRARRRRPVPHEGRQRRAVRRRACSSARACSSRATSMPPTPWST